MSVRIGSSVLRSGAFSQLSRSFPGAREPVVKTTPPNARTRYILHITPPLTAQAVAEQVARRVADLASFEAVAAQAKPWGFECLLIANNTTRDERFRLYEIELEMMEHVQAAGFKFYLIDRLDRPLEEVTTLDPSSTIVNLRRPLHAD